jgi:hypothetical protein
MARSKHTQTFADKFSNYYVSVADSIINSNSINNTNGDTKSVW